MIEICGNEQDRLASPGSLASVLVDGFSECKNNQKLNEGTDLMIRVLYP